MTDTEQPLRLSFTFPGSASLGAFQAGAVSAVAEMIEGLRDRGRDVRVDAVGGASAGSLVATIFAHCLTNGLPTADVLRQAWLEEVDVDLLHAGDSGSPLGFDELARRLPEFLRQAGKEADRKVNDGSLMLHIGLTNLLGLTYPVETGDSRSLGISYVDWIQFRLNPGGGVDQLIEPEGRAPLDFAYASAAHPGAFAPRVLDRTDDRDGYTDNGITNFPQSGSLWYTDGGLVESKPIGRIVQLARQHAGPADGLRMHLVIDPRSSGPSGSERWGDPDDHPSWLGGVRRALSILPTQALQEDLRGVAVTNDRLDMIDQLVTELAPMIDDHDRLAEVVDRLAPSPGSTEGDNADDSSSSAKDDKVGRPGRDDAEHSLRRLLERMGGVDGKERLEVEVISPLIVAQEVDKGVSDVLAGDFIGAFGGFLSRDLRTSDFRLGWTSARQWLPEALDRRGVDQATIDELCQRLDDHPAGKGDPDATDSGGIDSLDLQGRYRLARLAGRVGRILLQSAAPDVLSTKND